MLFCFLEAVLRSGDVTGHLENRGATGALLATYTSVILGIYLASSGPRRKWFLFALAAGTVATISTASRGSIVALAIT